jgi:CBS domain-containing protein
MKAGDAMVRPLVTVGPRDFARHAGGLMDDFGLDVLPVVDQGVFLGVVTRADVLRGKEGVRSPYVQQVMSARLSVLQLIGRNNETLHVEAGRAAVHS